MTAAAFVLGALISAVAVIVAVVLVFEGRP